MNRYWHISSACRLVALALILIPSTAWPVEEGFVSLFDGRSLAGWHGDPNLWRVHNGAIVGSTARKPIRKCSYLSTVRQYDDFILKVKFHLREGNSGIQIRSQQHGQYIVTGYQADITDEKWRAEALWHQGPNVSLVRTNPDELSRHLNKIGWNEYVITCQGPSITLAINGHAIARYSDPNYSRSARGIIAFQLVSRDIYRTTEIWLKDIRVKPL